MRSFKRTPIRDLPHDLYVHHMSILVIGGCVLIAAAACFSFWLNCLMETHVVLQDAKAVQMALCRAGEEQVGLGNKSTSLYDADTGELKDSFETEVKALSYKNGEIRLFELSADGTIASSMTYEENGYKVVYDEDGNPLWVITRENFPQFQFEY